MAYSRSQVRRSACLPGRAPSRAALTASRCSQGAVGHTTGQPPVNPRSAPSERRAMHAAGAAVAAAAPPARAPPPRPPHRTLAAHKGQPLLRASGAALLPARTAPICALSNGAAREAATAPTTPPLPPG
eukprot:214762-Chlamydomonas_euryale.AAC.4